jgi:hypothetical protein
MWDKLGKIRRKILSRVYIEFNSDNSNSIFLAGVGRSGTTWVSDIINYKNEYRYIFEPFHPHRVDICREFRYRQYLRPENQGKDFIEPVKSILSGRIRNSWTDKFNKKFICKKRLIKDIRANLLLGWIHQHFPNIPIILLLRHPCAVAHSKLKLNWNTHLNEFLAQEELMEDFLNPFRKEIEKAQSDFEKHIFLWCIENYVPLKVFKQGEIHLAFYENFCEKPEEEIQRLFSFLGKNFDETIFLNLKKPSIESRKHSPIVSGGSLIDSWMKHITDEQIRRAVDILSLFGLNSVYSQDSMPNIDNAYNMMRIE